MGYQQATRFDHHRSNDMETGLILNIEVGDIDTDMLDRLTRSLRGELLELGVNSAEVVASGDVPEGAKSPEAVTWGALAVAVVPTFLPKLVEYLQSWSMRGENRRVRIKTQVGDRSVEVEYSPSALSQEELTRLVDKLADSLAKADNKSQSS
jgi:hypothetical protein